MANKSLLLHGLLCVAALVLSSPGAFSQTPELLQDVITGTSSSFPRNFLKVGANAFFTASDDIMPQALWVTDGTPTGTREVAAFLSITDDLLTLGTTNLAFFIANDGATGNELWVSDGTPGGTTVLLDINPGTPSSSPMFITEVGGVLFFAASNATGMALWKSDGTRAGTVIVREVFGGAPEDFSTAGFVDVNGTLFFALDDQLSGFELWKSDGTLGGTIRVQDLRTGLLGSDPQELSPFNGQLVFSADDGFIGRELWITDGTPDSMVLLSDIFPGFTSSDPRDFLATPTKLFFSATNEEVGRELWVTDGTAPGTSLAKDISDLVLGGVTVGWNDDGAPSSGTGSLQRMGTTDSDTSSDWLWQTAGRGIQNGMLSVPLSGSTVVITELGLDVPDYMEIQNVSGAVVDTSGWVVVVGDSSASMSAKNTRFWTLPATMATGEVLYRTDSNVENFWGRDIAWVQTAPGWAMIIDELGKVVDFVAWGWTISDIAGFNITGSDSSPKPFAALGDLAFLNATDGVNGFEVWASDGTPGGTILLKDLNVGSGSVGVLSYAVLNGDLLFMTGETSTFKSVNEKDGDLFAAATVLAENLRGSSGPTTLRKILWKTDGTTVGTELVHDFGIVEGSFFGSVEEIFAVNRTLFFPSAQSSDTLGVELWTSDGTAAGTTQYSAFGERFDLEGTSITFTPNASADFYGACLDTGITAFPVDPTGGVSLIIGDDDSLFVSLGAATVSLYGTGYTGFFIGSNGYLTFDGLDTAFSGGVTTHFNQPRISGLFTDLDPGSGGTVSWKQLADRVAVTFEDVPQFSTTLLNSFQIELFFGGTIRITWLNIDSSAALVGLSQGILPTPVVLSDFSDYGACPTGGGGLSPDFFTEQFSSGSSPDGMIELDGNLIMSAFSLRVGREVWAVNISPIIQPSLASIDFGNVEVGTMAERTVSVANVGGTFLDGDALTSGPFSIVSGSPYSVFSQQGQDLTVRFIPTARTAFAADLVLTGDGDTTVFLVGTGTLPPAISVTPAQLNFGNIDVGVSSDMTFMIENLGDSVLNGTVSVPPPFSIVGNPVYAINAGQSQALTVRFSPVVRGSFAENVTFTGGGGASAPLTGAGIVAGTIAVDMNVLDFGTIQAGTVVELAFTVSNATDLPFSGMATTSPPFAVTAGASYTLAGGEMQQVRVTFSPTAPGIASGLVDLTGGGGALVLLQGDAAPGATLKVTPLDVAFGVVPVGVRSEVDLIVENVGSGILNGSAITASPFRIVTGSTFTLAAGEVDFVTVRFTPQTEGTFTSSILFTGGGGAEVPVTGIGTGTLGSITGMVMSEEDGSPLICATVRARSLTGAFQSIVTTDLNGFYFLADIPATAYELQAFAPGFASQSELIVLEAESTPEVDFVMPPEFSDTTIFGTVTDEKTGVPLAGVRIDAFNTDTNEFLVTTYTCASGDYEVALDDALTRKGLSAVTLVFDSRTHDVKEVEVPIVPGMAVEEDVALTRKSLFEAQITGIVRDSSDALPIPGVRVVAQRFGDLIGRTGFTDANGVYLIAGLGQGQFRVSASAMEFQTALENTNLVNDGASVVLDFLLTPGGGVKTPGCGVNVRRQGGLSTVAVDIALMLSVGFVLVHRRRRTNRPRP